MIPLGRFYVKADMLVKLSRAVAAILLLPLLAVVQSFLLYSCGSYSRKFGLSYPLSRPSRSVSARPIRFVGVGISAFPINQRRFY